jgi:predicted membrane channel-forming protein YqfA (hemolysin III family)
MQTVLFIALVANSLDLLLSTLGIHYYHNREGNPLLAGVAHHHWWIFVLIKGALIPLLIVRLYTYRRSSPLLATAGLGLVTVALTVAVGQWLGWMAGVLHVSGTRL